MQAVFEQWFTRYRADVFRLCLSYLHDWQLAEDATQETFVKAWRALPGLKVQTERSWLLRVAANTCLDVLRTPWRRRVSTYPAAEDYADLPDACRADAQTELLLDLQRLPDTERQVLLLHYLRRMPQREIAERLQLSPSAVARRMSRAHARLRQMWA